jgi:hypothetical protein
MKLLKHQLKGGRRLCTAKDGSNLATCWRSAPRRGDPRQPAGICPGKGRNEAGPIDGSAQRITNLAQVADARDYMMLATLCSAGKYQLAGPFRGAQGCGASRGSRALRRRPVIPGCRHLSIPLPEGNGMLALATVVNGPNPSTTMIIIAAIAAAIFWRGLIKFGIALVVILFAVLLITGTSDLFHDLRVLIQ